MSNKGGISIPVFECIFNGASSITSFTRTYDQSLYEILENLYVICIAKGKGKRQVVGGFFLKTSYTHEDGKDFQDALAAAVTGSENLNRFFGENYTLLPAKLGIVGTAPLSENEMLYIFSQQYLKYSSAGNA